MGWIKVHSWNVNKVNVTAVGQPDRTLEDWGNNHALTAYVNQADVHLYCAYDNYELPIAHWPANKHIGDISPNVVHECTSLPPIEEDPDYSWIWQPTGEEPETPDTDPPQ